MAAGTFEKNNLDWQMQQVQQQAGEWVESIFFNNAQLPLNGLDWSLPNWLTTGCFWLITAALGVWSGWQLYKLLNPYFQTSLQSAKEQVLKRGPSSQASELTTAEWLQRSRTAQQQGNYREACRTLYMAMLQRLNDQHLLQQEPSRTDGEYLNLIQTLNRSQAYQLLIHTHEQLCFSDAAVSADLCDRCWQAYQEIERA